MAIRTPKFKLYTENSALELPVTQWAPGMSAIPDEFLGHHLDDALLAFNFKVDHPETIRTGILNAEWQDHPAFALVIATSVNRLPVEPFLVSEGPVATSV